MLDDFVQTISDSQYLPQRKFVWEMLYGMITSGSVRLADIARKLETDKELIHIEKRLSRNLHARRLDEEELQNQYLELVASRINHDTSLAIDIGDITKKYAEQMQNLGEVWDGRKGEKTTGYWLVEIEAHDSDGKRTGLYAEAWSHAAGDFTSRNNVILQALGKVSAVFDQNGVWIGDRGLDGEDSIRGFDDLQIRYIIRQRGDRYVQTVGRTLKQSVRALAQEVKLTGRLDVWHRQKAGRWELKNLRYGWVDILWPKNNCVCSLVVIVGWGKEPVMLWTNISVKKAKGALFVIKSFMRRWAVEDSGRVLKQEFDLARVRVEGWLAIRRTVICAWLAYGFVCLVQTLGETLIQFIISLVRAFRAPKKVWAYRIRQGIAELLKGGLLFRPSNFG